MNKKIFFAIALFLGVLLFNCAPKKTVVVKSEVKPPKVIPAEVKKEIIADDYEVNSEIQKIEIPIYQKNAIQYFDETNLERVWVDSIYASLSLDDKISQMMMFAAYPNKDEVHYAIVDMLISENKIGGLIHFQGGPVKQAKLTNRFQAKSKIPLLIGIDAEWGLNMRVDSTYKFPFNMTLGAIQDNNLIEKLGKKMGAESKRMGIHFTFSPVVDINTNPSNPIIGNRSFGENKDNVSDKAIAIMKGVNSQGVLATAKHFPGHGDTSTDSHTTLPILMFDKKRLDSIELYPYKKLIPEGLQSIMVAHLSIPSLDTIPGLPTSLSKKVVTDLLKTELNFKGLIITDALNMKGASNALKPGNIELAAFLAGNDILLMPENVSLAISTIKKAFFEGQFTENRLAESVKKILSYKYKIGLNKYKPIVIENLYNDINSPIQNDSLQYALYENAITVLKNEQKILPLRDLTKKIAYIKLGTDSSLDFVESLQKYTQVTEISATTAIEYNQKLANFDFVIIGYHPSDKAFKGTNFTEQELNLISEIAASNKVILDVFVRPYNLLQITNFADIEAVIVSYQNNKISQIVSSEIIFGAIQARGKLPVTLHPNFKLNEGIVTENLFRLGFSSPEFVGMNSNKLAEIERYTSKAINQKLAPGMQVLVARKGKVIYQKSFGFKTYDQLEKIKNTDLYDLASITKITATLPIVMQQYDKKKLKLGTTLKEMLPEFKNSDKEDIIFMDLLSHHARLEAWEPFYKLTLDSLKFPLKKYYNKGLSAEFSRKVTDSLYFRTDYHDTIMKYIKDSKLAPTKAYKYSDFTFMLLAEYLKKETDKSVDQLATENFYKSMGMNYTLFNPLKRFPKNDIVPSEVDSYFRHATLQGYVHDMAAALEGGVAGHAGLFSNALDVAKMMQMYLQKGRYGTKKYFSDYTFDSFNNCYYCDEGNRRGLGFDKPQANKKDATCDCVSMRSFGHTGFTGGITWADPETEIVYVFLSNRTYPESNGNALSRELIREDIQRIIQDAIIK